MKNKNNYTHRVDETEQEFQAKHRVKMYKDGKKWVAAGLTALSVVIGAGFAGNAAGIVSADTISGDVTATDNSATQGDTVTLSAAAANTTTANGNSSGSSANSTASSIASDVSSAVSSAAASSDWTSIASTGSSAASAAPIVGDSSSATTSTASDANDQGAITVDVNASSSATTGIDITTSASSSGAATSSETINVSLPSTSDSIAGISYGTNSAGQTTATTVGGTTVVLTNDSMTALSSAAASLALVLANASSAAASTAAVWQTYIGPESSTAAAVLASMGSSNHLASEVAQVTAANSYFAAGNFTSAYTAASMAVSYAYNGSTYALVSTTSDSNYAALMAWKNSYFGNGQSLAAGMQIYNASAASLFNSQAQASLASAQSAYNSAASASSSYAALVTGSGAAIVQVSLTADPASVASLTSAPASAVSQMTTDLTSNAANLNNSTAVSSYIGGSFLNMTSSSGAALLSSMTAVYSSAVAAGNSSAASLFSGILSFATSYLANSSLMAITTSYASTGSMYISVPGMGLDTSSLASASATLTSLLANVNALTSAAFTVPLSAGTGSYSLNPTDVVLDAINAAVQNEVAAVNGIQDQITNYLQNVIPQYVANIFAFWYDGYKGDDNALTYQAMLGIQAQIVQIVSQQVITQAQSYATQFSSLAATYAAKGTTQDTYIAGLLNQVAAAQTKTVNAAQYQYTNATNTLSLYLANTPTGTSHTGDLSTIGGILISAIQGVATTATNQITAATTTLFNQMSTDFQKVASTMSTALANIDNLTGIETNTTVTVGVEATAPSMTSATAGTFSDQVYTTTLSGALNGQASTDVIYQAVDGSILNSNYAALSEAATRTNLTSSVATSIAAAMTAIRAVVNADNTLVSPATTSQKDIDLLLASVPLPGSFESASIVVGTAATYGGNTSLATAGTTLASASATVSDDSTAISMGITDADLAVTGYNYTVSYNGSSYPTLAAALAANPYYDQTTNTGDTDSAPQTFTVNYVAQPLTISIYNVVNGVSTAITDTTLLQAAALINSYGAKDSSGLYSFLWLIQNMSAGVATESQIIQAAMQAGLISSGYQPTGVITDANGNTIAALPQGALSSANITNAYDLTSTTDADGNVTWQGNYYIQVTPEYQQVNLNVTAPGASSASLAASQAGVTDSTFSNFAGVTDASLALSGYTTVVTAANGSVFSGATALSEAIAADSTYDDTNNIGSSSNGVYTAATSDASMQTLSVTYTADTQVANVVYVDDTTGDTVATGVSVSGATDSDITFNQASDTLTWSTTGSAADLSNYVIGTIDAPTTFDDDDSVDQTITVHLTHKIVDSTLTTTAVVTYTGAGANTPDAVSADVQYTTATDQVTGITTYTLVSEPATVDTPAVTNYVADQASVSYDLPTTTTTTPIDLSATVTYSVDPAIPSAASSAASVTETVSTSVASVASGADQSASDASSSASAAASSATIASDAASEANSSASLADSIASSVPGNSDVASIASEASAAASTATADSSVASSASSVATSAAS
ncbi:MAG: KxYKxGKxW signal peptide domain-containing protein, partial [Lactobacillaceae bacterium]|nr:KxYKxGKxW signal peptide domain-containing protein [Lactobacillaceae bacterium]